MHLTCTLCYCVCVHVNTPQSGGACECVIKLEMFLHRRCQSLVVCVSRLGCPSCTHSYPCILSSYCNTYFSCASAAVTVPTHRCSTVLTRVTSMCVAEAQLTAWQPPWNWRPSHTDARCFAWQPGVLGVNLCQECWVTVNGREKMGVICRVSLLAQPLGLDGALRSPRGIRDSLVSEWAWKQCVMYRLHYML